jgi:hypothetical protein
VAHEEVMPFIEQQHRMGSGLEYIDMHLPAAAILMEAPLWTLDRNLCKVSLKLETER